MALYKKDRVLKVRESIPFGIQRKIISHITTKSWRNVPHVSYVYEADVTEFLAEYEKLKASGRHTHKITFNTLLLRVVVEAVHAAPQVNAHISYNRRTHTGRIDIIENINISMPWILPGGQMMTINLQDFGSKSLDEMTAYLEDISHRLESANLDLAMLDVSLHDTRQLARRGRILTVLQRGYGAVFGKNRLRRFTCAEKKAHRDLPQEDRLGIPYLEEGTILVSNLGAAVRGLGGYVGLLEIVPPQVLAIGIAAIQEKPGILYDKKGEAEICARKYLPLCMTFDHRALDFGELAPFMRRKDDIFKNPEIIHEW